MKTLTFLLSTVIELYTMVMLLRVWMQWARCDFYNPFSQFRRESDPANRRAAAPDYSGNGAAG